MDDVLALALSSGGWVQVIHNTVGTAQQDPGGSMVGARIRTLDNVFSLDASLFAWSMRRTVNEDAAILVSSQEVLRRYALCRTAFTLSLMQSLIEPVFIPFIVSAICSTSKSRSSADVS